ncbi:hypothetical protein CO670_22535 [Rhizobium sp. J15]|uniref:Molecular chaperone GroEL n=1 Tax=Rhizobium chutanense TaxID=2035448 RepID=A0A2A6J652_9HYPH|nr:hypothetical protein CO650_24360 [Rhizobium phaseoli]PDT01565.1 hypothetical protein CO666_25050 [Rhizobium chutanense]PDT14560.1 hypothetical protein CO670_22535 [Rhizobium sp. J15]
MPFRRGSQDRRDQTRSLRAHAFDPYLSPYFVANQDKMRVEFEDPYILIHEKKLSNLQSLLPVS